MSLNSCMLYGVPDKEKHIYCLCHVCDNNDEAYSEVCYMACIVLFNVVEHDIDDQVYNIVIHMPPFLPRPCIQISLECIYKWE